MRLTALAAVLILSRELPAQVDVLGRHNDQGRTGANLQETVLSPATVNNQQFGKLAYRIVDGNVYAQPLIVSGAKVAHRSGPANIAIVATEHNSIYAFDAEDTAKASTKAQLWHTGPKVLGKAADSLKLYTAIGNSKCADLTTEVGITSTPAIRLTNTGVPKQGVIFVVAKSEKGGNYSYQLFALRLADGAKLGALTIQGDVPGEGVGSKNGRVAFQPLYELNRPALLLSGNTLIVAFGGHCDEGPYHGWVFAYNVSNPKSIQSAGIWCTTPQGSGSKKESRAGIWMSGEGPALDDDGAFYVSTGDGTFNPGSDFANSVVKLKAGASGLSVADWFTPANHEFLKERDLDLGSGGVLLLPGTRQLIAGGKEGKLYLIDRHKMGKGLAMPLAQLQATHDPEGPEHEPKHYNLHGNPVVWPRGAEMFLYSNGEENPFQQYRLLPDATTGQWHFDSAQPFRSSANCAAKPNCVTAPYPNYPAGVFGHEERPAIWMPGGMLSLSANGATDHTGILWVTSPLSGNANEVVVRGVLRALDASDVSKPELWDSESTGNANDHLGQFAKFNPPTIANGKVYVGTFQEETMDANHIHHIAPAGDRPALAIYGLKH